MACLMPLRAVRVGDKVLVKKRVDLFEDLNGTIDLSTGEYCEPFDVPCGKCLNCRLDYARTWANRCMLESMYWESNWFITFTYDDEHLPVGKMDLATLKAKDTQDFMKRLRKYYSDRGHENVRFYLAGEYGDTTFRPHYHMLGFNLPINDLFLYSRSLLGDCYYVSASLSKIWGKGFVVVAELTEQSASYTARYCMKKANKSIDYDAVGIEKEFVRMSRRPGIGYYYFIDHLDEVYDDGKIYLPNGKTCAPFRYFDEKAQALGINVEKAKNERQQRAILQEQERCRLLSVDEWQRFEDMEEALTKRARSLKRNLC